MNSHKKDIAEFGPAFAGGYGGQGGKAPCGTRNSERGANGKTIGRTSADYADYADYAGEGKALRTCHGRSSAAGASSGNLRIDGTRRYVYDAFNRLKQVYKTPPSYAVQIAEGNRGSVPQFPISRRKARWIGYSLG